MSSKGNMSTERQSNWMSVTLLAFLFGAGGVFEARAASAFAGFYTGYVYSSISGAITVPEAPIGPAAFTVDNDGNISGNLTGTVDAGGNITWSANATGFSTGTISGGVLASTISQNNGGAVTTFRIAANTTAGGFGGGGTVAQSLVWQRPSPSGVLLRGVTHGGGKFVAVGPGGSVAVSGNGTNWVAVNANTTQQLNAVAHGNGVYVAVGDGATAISSPDGLSWTARSIGNFQNFVGVAFGNGTFVAVNLVNEIYTSPDGAAWTKVENSSVGPFWNNLKFVGGIFVLVGQSGANGRIRTSPNGANWNSEILVASTGGIADVTFGHGVWLGVSSTRFFTFAADNASDAAATAFSGLGDAVGFVNDTFVSDNRHYSADGVTWKRDSYPNLDINDMVTANGLLVAVGAAMTSTTDGRLWTVHSKVLPGLTPNNHFSHTVASGTVSGDIYDEIEYYNAQGAPRFLRMGVGGILDERVNGSSPYANVVSPTRETLRDGFSFGGATALGVGDNGAIARFGSGVNAWTNVASGTTANLRSIAGQSGNNVVAVGSGGVILRTTNGGQTWGSISSGTGNTLNRVAYFTGSGFNYYVAVGDNGTILKSTDGSSWAALNSGTTGRLVGIGQRTTGNVKLMALAEDSTVLVSEDHGTTWRAVTVNAPLALVCLNGSTAYGEGGFQMTSGDGTNWVYGLPSVSPGGVGHGNGRVVLNAGLARLVSTDLENWLAFPGRYSHSGLAFGNGILVSVGGGSSTTGEGFVSTSVDGTRWIDRATPTLLNLNAVASGQGKFVAVGSSGTILSSSNGVHWVNRTITGSQELRGVAFGGGAFVAVGASGTSRYSTDGENWTSGSPGGTLNAITHGNGLFVAVGDSGAIRTSANGTSWSSRGASPGTSRSLRAIRYAGGRFVAVGDQDGTGNGAVVVHSTDGVTWTKEVANIAAPLLAASASSGTYVAVGANGVLVTAPFQDAGSPNLTVQPGPASQTVNAGVNVTYTVTVTGTGLQYRWLKDGVPLADGAGVSGATTASLNLTGVDVLDAGEYRVSVWNDAGSALSQPLALNVNGPPVITVPPVSVTTSNTLTTNFTVVAIGPGPLGFQWRHNGQLLADGGGISGATTATLTLGGVRGTNEGTYVVTATNAFGASAPGPAVTLTVNRPPTITQPPADVNLNQGQTIQLTVQADGSPTLGYQWRRNGADLSDGGRVSGATAPTLTITGAVVADAGAYTVVVTNSFAPAATSVAAQVSILGPGALHPALTFNGAGTVFDIAPTPDGKFAVVGGLSLSSDGRSWSRVMKVDQNGTPVLSFATTNTANQPNSTVKSVAVYPDGRMVVGGDFSQWGGNVTYAYAARLSADGELDTGYQLGLSALVRKVRPLPGDKLLLARSGNGFATSWVNRYDAGGGADAGFTEIVNLNRSLVGLAAQSDGTIWLSGLFGLKQAAADGTNPAGVQTFAPFSEMAEVFVGPDDKVYYSDNNGQYFGRLLADGTRDTGFNVTLNGHVRDMAFLPGGGLIIVGSFQTVNSVTRAYFAVLEHDGSLVTSIGSPYVWASGQSLYAIELLADGTALVGGTVSVTVPTAQKGLQRIQIADLPAAGISFSTWAGNNNLPPGQAGPGDDADSDGVPNFVEFALGTNPTSAASRALPADRKVRVGNVDYPGIAIIRRKDTTGANVQVEAYGGVPFGSALATVQEGAAEDLGDGTERVIVRVNTPLAQTAAVFFRTKVVQQ